MQIEMQSYDSQEPNKGDKAKKFEKKGNSPDIFDLDVSRTHSDDDDNQCYK